jgi:hypothetical protein
VLDSNSATMNMLSDSQIDISKIVSVSKDSVPSMSHKKRDL